MHSHARPPYRKSAQRHLKKLENLRARPPPGRFFGLFTKNSGSAMPAPSVTTAEQDLLTIAYRVPEAIRAPLEDLDAVGHALRERVGDAVVEVVEDLLAPPLQRAPCVEELGDAGAGDGVDPFIESALCLQAIGSFVDRREQFLEHPRDAELVDRRLEHLPQPLALCLGELVGALHEQPARSEDRR